MLGQLLSKKDAESAWELTLKISEKYNFDSKLMLSHFKKLKTVNDSFINSAVSMMSMCACYLYYNHIIENKSDVLSFQIKNYIETHFNENLTIKNLCNTFFISKTKLYHLSLKSFNMGISDYIRYQRLEKAKELLKRSSDKTISSIAFETGFNDANYFSRIFKKYTGGNMCKMRCKIQPRPYGVFLNR